MTVLNPKAASTSNSAPVPGPYGLPFIGVLPDMTVDRLRFVARNRERYGDVVGYRIGPARLLQLNHPRDIESVLVGRHHHFVKDTITRSLELVMGNGLVTSEGEFWRHQRKLLAPSFQPRHIAGYAATMVEEARALVERLEHGTVIDAHAEMSALTLRIVTRTLFGAQAETDGDAHRIGALVADLMAAFEELNFGWARLLPPWVPNAPAVRMRRYAEQVDQAFENILRTRGRETTGDDLLARMLAARDDSNARMLPGQLRDEAITMFLAGHETTAVALTYALYLLARNPEIFARLRDEVVEVVGDRIPAVADVERLSYTDAVVRESMRLYPPVWAMGREVVVPCSIAGVDLSVGAQIMLSQWVVHRDARWHDDPEAFAPGRWLDGCYADKPAFAYFPFGGGPRICIGNRFAMMEAVLILATLTQAFAFVPGDDKALELVPAVTLRPKDGVMLELRRP